MGIHQHRGNRHPPPLLSTRTPRLPSPVTPPSARRNPPAPRKRLSAILSGPGLAQYDQPQHEWVIVLKGAARLQFEDGMVEMRAGDFINIPANKKHRVDWTMPDEPTVWLGVRYGETK